MTDFPSRPLPELTPFNKPFWTSGRDGVLRMPRCISCGQLLHPTQAVCPKDLSDAIEYAEVSGKATVVGTTVGSHYFLPGFAPPYNIAIVALDEDPAVRLMTNVFGVEPHDVLVGMRVIVGFDEQGPEDNPDAHVWFPVFFPNPDEPELAPLKVQAPQVKARPMASSSKFEDKVAITGIGMSQVGRRLMKPPITLTVEACKAAVADAGLTMADIDGLCTYPGGLPGAGGISEGGVPALEEALRIEPVWHNGGMETSGQTGSIVAAMLAVASGLCKHVLCFRTVWESTNTEMLRTGQLPLPSGGRVSGDWGYKIPYGAASAAHWIAMYTSQHMQQFGTTRETLGWIAMNARANAARNPYAIYQEPITMEDYLSARMISTPFGLYDCDVPCDGSVAVIISAKETAKDLRQSPVLVEAVGTAIGERQSWDQGTVTHLPNVFGPAKHLWSRTELRTADVDVAEIYDGFSFNALSWLEALGFCGVGEAKDYLEGGKRIAMDGELPMNTHGGQLSAGRLHGYGFIHEAVLQLRGQADERQVKDAKVSVVAVGGGVPAGAFLLRSAQ